MLIINYLILMEKKETEICQSFEDNCMISTSHKTNALRLPIHIIFNILQYNYPKEKLYQCRIICKPIKSFVINLIKESVNKLCIITFIR